MSDESEIRTVAIICSTNKQTKHLLTADNDDRLDERDVSGLAAWTVHSWTVTADDATLNTVLLRLLLHSDNRSSSSRSCKQHNHNHTTVLHASAEQQKLGLNNIKEMSNTRVVP